MNRIIKKLTVCLVLAVMLLLCACGKKAKNIPYTEIGFEDNLEAVLALEGNEYESYDSIYYGTTYTFDKEYLGRMGKIKYMFNDKDELCNISWSCKLDDGEKADILYKEIYALLQKDYGAPEDKTGVNNYGTVWKMEDGNIILSAIISSEANIVQVGFLSPEVSRDEDGKLKGQENSAPAEDSSEGEQQMSEGDVLNVTLDEISAANSFEALLSGHKSVAYKSTQYANEDVDEGYLGFDNTIISKNGDDYSYKSSAASQSVPFTVIVEKSQDGKYTQKTQFAGESIVETEYESEDSMKKDVSKLWYFGSEAFSDEVKVDASMQDGALVITTERTPKGGEYASDTITRYYFVNPDTLELYAINEYMPTGTDYGTVLTNTSIIYDEDPDFDIEFSPEPEENVTDDDYANMGSAEDGEE